MKKVIDVNTGEVGLGMEGTMLRSVAIGSCIVVAAYDSENSIGAMAHIMLPGTAPKKTLEKTRYAADAIDEMINMMTQAESKKSDIEVCLVGGGNVLKKKDDAICKDNIESTTRILKEKNIPVRASALGGTRRKSVFLDIENGSISFAEGDEKEKTLWKAGQRQLN